MTSGRLWNYYREETDDVDDNASDGKSFEYKTKWKEKHRKDQHDLLMNKM